MRLKRTDNQEMAAAPDETMREACECAYNLLSDAEKEALNRQIAVLVDIHGMGRKSALELLAKVGLWLNENEPQRSGVKQCLMVWMGQSARMKSYQPKPTRKVFGVSAVI
jgi:hypothetical protein